MIDSTVLILEMIAGLFWLAVICFALFLFYVHLRALLDEQFRAMRNDLNIDIKRITYAVEHIPNVQIEPLLEEQRILQKMAEQNGAEKMYKYGGADMKPTDIDPEKDFPDVWAQVDRLMGNANGRPA